ncbi:MAG: hypothetical protein N3G21_10675 [Candidatus Hydrogenedentes bacterium]|nr:hypothetical protein [Candidatus Hydrogenedentota bacterium]
MKQLVVFFGGIGDTILFAPSVKLLSKQGEITFVGYPERAMLLREVGWVREVYSPEQVDFESIFDIPSDRLRGFLAKFTKAYFFIREAEKILKTARESGIEEIVTLPGIPPSDWDLHASEYYLSALELKQDEEFLLPIESKFKHNWCEKAT